MHLIIKDVNNSHLVLTRGKQTVPLPPINPKWGVISGCLEKGTQPKFRGTLLKIGHMCSEKGTMCSEIGCIHSITCDTGM